MTARERSQRLDEIDRILSGIRYQLAGMTGWSASVLTERDRLLRRRGELEEERERLLNGGSI